MSLEITSLISNISAPAVAGAIIGIVIGIIPILKGDIENAWKKHFCRQVRSGIIKDHLSYEDMLHIAERWRQDRKSILLALRVMHSEAIAGEDEDLSKSLSEIRELIQKHQKLEPYSELPEN